MPQDLDAVDWPVTTERLVIRRATVDDVDDVYRYRRLPEVFEWLTDAPATIDDARRLLSDPDRLARTLVVEERGGGGVIGDLMVRIEDPWAQSEVAEQAKGLQAELGWSLDPAFAGRGLATEAVAAMVDVCFGVLGLRRVVAGCFADNAPSWRLMERLGMRRETHAVRDALHRTKGWLDGFDYALLAEEWHARPVAGR